jgi:hypothetical protein
MDIALTLPTTLPYLLTLSPHPGTLGHAVGTMLYHISPLVSTHLSNPLPFHNPTPSALSPYPDFITSIDHLISHLRHTHALPSPLPSHDRKARIRRRKTLARLTSTIEAAYKSYVRERLSGVFEAWSAEETQAFHKGVDKGVSGVQWVVYPVENVVVKVGEGHWAGWLKRECDGLGRGRVKLGEGAFDDV